jgi:hypothetical protein
MLRDRRGVGVAEYALLLFLVIAVAAGTYRFMGARVKHAGNKTNQQFAQGGAAGSGGAGSQQGGADNAGGGNANTGGGAAGGGGGAAGGGGGGAGAGGGAGGGSGKAGASGASGGSDLDDAEGTQNTPLWKIIGCVFLVLFAVGGFFAFRKKKG